MREWQATDGPMPAIFLSHGAPPLFEDVQWMRELHAWSASMPKPTGIVMVSAHWESAPISISSPTAHTPLVYDFSGFDPKYFAMQYKTPDATTLASRITQILDESVVQTNRGLDHGAWVPLKVMYPAADIPVLQVSMPTQDPERLMRIGSRLAELRHEGVLVVGSGFMTHGLPFLTADAIHLGKVPSWSADFDAWAHELVLAGDVEQLMDTQRAPGMPYAHPTQEHWAPLFISLGASAGDPAASVIDGYMWGLSRRSYAFA
jgi:4,5-DOPA dioxygenase extradiol